MGMAPASRAKPNAAARLPSRASVSAALRPMSGRRAGKAPPEHVLAKTKTQTATMKATGPSVYRTGARVRARALLSLPRMRWSRALVPVAVLVVLAVGGPAAAAAPAGAPPGGDVTTRPSTPRLPAGDVAVDAAKTPGRGSSAVLTEVLPSTIAEWEATFGVPLVASGVAVTILLLLVAALGVYTIL